MSLSKVVSSVVWEDVYSLFRISWKKWLIVSMLIGFLLYMLNIFLSVSLYTNAFAQELRGKLGMYFYIKDMPDNEAYVYREIMKLKDELEAKGLTVVFSSKEDSFSFLEKKMPDIVSNFKRFNIENPLPATLYVMFTSEDQYEVLRSTIIKYKDIILNITDINRSSTLKQQENRVLTILNFTRFLRMISYILIVVLSGLIMVLFVFLVGQIFQLSRTKIEIQKTLGATYQQITKPLVITSTGIALSALIIGLVLSLATGFGIDFYVKELFDVSIMQHVWDYIYWFIIILVLQFIIMITISIIFSYKYTYKLQKHF